MERLFKFAELKEEVRKIERFVARCNGLFLNANDYADKYARTKNLDDLNRALKIKRLCRRLVEIAEIVCRQVGEFFVGLCAFDDVKIYAETFDLLTVAQEVVRDCLGWYRELCEDVDKFVFAVAD